MLKGWRGLQYGPFHKSIWGAEGLTKLTLEFRLLELESRQEVVLVTLCYCLRRPYRIKGHGCYLRSDIVRAYAESFPTDSEHFDRSDDWMSLPLLLDVRLLAPIQLAALTAVHRTLAVLVFDGSNSVL